MSDDDYPAGGYSPYSDLEDLLYDADPENDLADDLASHAIHSPIFGDEPGYELLDYHSDWDYYSDDYYDDDPAILKNNPQDGSPIRRKSAKEGNGQKRGKKRKLVGVGDIPDLDLGERRTLKDCMKGTVWARPIPPRDNSFVPGKEEKIALLKDWKSRFGTMPLQQNDGRKRHQLRQDESWANEMSLADMGLMNERTIRVEQGTAAEAIEEDEEEAEGAADYAVDEEMAATLLEEMDGAGDTGAREHVEEGEGPYHDAALATSPEITPAKRRHPLSEVHSIGQSSEALPMMNKRRKQNDGILPSPSISNAPHSTTTDHTDALITGSTTGAEKDQQPRAEQKRGRGRPRQEPQTDSKAQARSTSKMEASGSKKRKASMSPSPEPHTRGTGVSRSTASSRAKRVASNVKPMRSETSEKENGGMNVSTRSTRSRKK